MSPRRTNDTQLDLAISGVKFVKVFSRIIIMVAVVIVCSAVCCCNGQPDPVKFFKEHQIGTVTPHGRINIASVLKAGASALQYQTEDGNTWKVSATADGAGGFRYGEPEEVKN